MKFEPNAKTLFLILGSNAPENESDLEMQKQTWLSDLSPTQGFIILRGSPSTSTTLIGDELYLPVIESYENILPKTILGMKWALDNSNFEILIRTNVSTYFPRAEVEAVTRTINKAAPFFGGYVARCRLPGENINSTTDFVAGTALVLTRQTAQILCDLDWTPYYGWPDDVAISMALSKVGISPKKIRRNNLSQSHFFFPAFQIRLKTSSVSHLSSKRMESIHEYFHATNTLNRLARYLLISMNEIRYAFINWEEISDFAKGFFSHVWRYPGRIVRLGK